MKNNYILKAYNNSKLARLAREIFSGLSQFTHENFLKNMSRTSIMLKGEVCIAESHFSIMYIYYKIEFLGRSKIEIIWNSWSSEIYVD